MDFEDDDLSKAISESIDTHGLPGEAPSAPVADKTAGAPEAAAPAAKSADEGRARDETGKFVKQEAPPAAEDKTKLAAPETGTAAQPQAAPSIAEIAAPTNWKGAGKIAWAALSKDVQQQISEDYAGHTKTRAELQQFKSAIGDDRAQLLAANYGSVSQGLQNLFALSDFASKNPTGFSLWFAQQRGIDLTQLVQGAGQGQQQQGQADASHPMMARISQLETQLQQFTQQQNQSHTSVLQSEIERFAADPSHPYFNDVRPAMAALMNSGEAKTLSEAYDAAVWAKPNIRTSLLEAERKKAFEANAAKVVQASNAAVSITGSPTGGKTPPADEPETDLEATIRKNVERAFAA